MQRPQKCLWSQFCPVLLAAWPYASYFPQWFVVLNHRFSGRTHLILSLHGLADRGLKIHRPPIGKFGGGMTRTGTVSPGERLASVDNADSACRNYLISASYIWPKSRRSPLHQFIVPSSQVRKVNEKWLLKALSGVLLLLESGSVSIRLQQFSVLHLFSSASEQSMSCQDWTWF